ncbi:hypothetical protein P4110_11050 [Pseudomonas aeruginosa]|nr:hypothetical protein [Pseudomonas aeruginosa]
MARTTLESIQHAIEVNSSLALPIALENLSRLTHTPLLTVPFNMIHILVFSLKDFARPRPSALRAEIMYARRHAFSSAASACSRYGCAANP